MMDSHRYRDSLTRASLGLGRSRERGPQRRALPGHTATPLLSSAEATASVACPGDCGAIPENSILAAIIESLPDESDTEAWKAHFEDSYLDGHVIYPTDPASLDPSLEVYSTPQGKWMTAAYLITYGVNSSNMTVYGESPTDLETDNRPWHGWFDYARLGKARSTLAHYVRLGRLQHRR